VDGRLRGSNPQPVTFGLFGVYAASRINSNLKGSTKQFGCLQAPATKPSSFQRLTRSLRLRQPSKRRPLRHFANGKRPQVIQIAGREMLSCQSTGGP